VGGKSKHLPFITSLLPRTEKYVEPFGGSGSVLLNLEPTELEVLNDLDEEINNFYRILRSRHQGDLIDSLSLTPYSRQVFREFVKQDPRHLTDFERAVRYFVIASQGRDGMTQQLRPSAWSAIYRAADNRIGRILRSIQNLPELAGRLMRVVLENRQALDIIGEHDSPEATFYVDPPYPHGTRNGILYKHEMTDKDHRILAARLQRCQGWVAISSYDSDLYRRLYTEHKGWRRHEDRRKHTTVSNRNKPAGEADRRQEIVWTNYEVDGDFCYR
jgi:DNA adenine methylase